MANTDPPKGLVPIKHRNGAPYNGAANPYYKPAGYATALFVGDVVVKTGTANTAAASAPGLGDFNIATLPEINTPTPMANARLVLLLASVLTPTI